LHGTDTTLVGIDPSFLPLTRFSVMASDAVTVPSTWLATITRQHLGLPATFAIEVLPNFVDTDRFAPPSEVPLVGSGVPVVVHVSNFRPLKRVDDVVRVFARVRARRPARLRLVGDGPTREDALTLARSLGVAADIEVLGERDDLPAQLGAAAVFLLPSASESFGLAALEALACGVPVVASNVGGLPEVVSHGAVGFLHPVGDCEAMAESVGALLDDPALRARFGRAGRALAEGAFRVEPAVDRYEAVYRRVLAMPPAT
jgi:N-acetyl-alpha-D-glucosaminyl L-malate synthase BshA